MNVVFAPDALRIQSAPPPVTIRLIGDDGRLRTIDDLENEIAQAAIDHFGGDISQAARSLGIGRSTIYRWLNRS